MVPCPIHFGALEDVDIVQALNMLTEDRTRLKVRGLVDLKFTVDIVPSHVIRCKTNKIWDVVVFLGARREGATGTGPQSIG